MALALRTNGAMPLSGALFVSNPRPRRAAKRNARKNGASAAPKARANKRRKARKVRKGTKRAFSAVRNASRKNAARKNGVKLARSAKGRFLKRRNGAVKVKANTTRRRRSTRRRNPVRARRNGLALARPNRSRRRVMRRRNTGSGGGYGFINGITAKAKSLVAKVPVLGTFASRFVAPVLVGALVGGVHYYGVAALQKLAPGILDSVSPVKFTLTGVAVATLLKSGLPGINKIPTDLANQLATGALVVGGALDAYRALSDKLGDLGEAVSLYDYSDAVPLYDYSGAGYGDGGYYDVVPMQPAGSSYYAGAEEGDAMFAPDDLAMDEGEAALGGLAFWRNTFGAEPRQQQRSSGYHSSLAGQPGHRFGWLIKMIGFDNFQKVAAMPPAERQAWIAAYKAEALKLADAKLAAQQAPTTPAQGSTVPNTTPPPMAGIGMDFGASMYAGSHYSGVGASF